MAKFYVPTRPHHTAFAAALLGVAAIAGSGGVTQLAPTTRMGYPFPNSTIESSSQHTSTSDQLRLVLSAMAVSNVGLARALNVSRQTIYNWLSGETARAEHQALIDSLIEASEIISRIPTPTNALLKQPLEDGNSFWELVQRGSDPRQLAGLLKTRYESRNNQRELIAQRMAAKRASGGLVPFDLDAMD
jgi:hypothetical protein